MCGKRASVVVSESPHFLLDSIETTVGNAGRSLKSFSFCFVFVFFCREMARFRWESLFPGTLDGVRFSYRLLGVDKAVHGFSPDPFPFAWRAKTQWKLGNGPTQRT